MASLMWNLILASALLLLAHHAYGSTEIIDTEPNSIESIAAALCHGGGAKRIGRQSTIGQLVDYFSSLSSKSELISCSNQYLKPLTDLKIVLDTSSEDACSKAKMEQVYKFHWDFIAAGLFRKWHQSSIKGLPEPLRLFFMHYADEIAEKCKITMGERLEAAAVGNNLQAEALFSSKLGSSINELSFVMVPASKVKNFDSFLLLWNQIIAKERRKGHEISDIIDESTGESVFVLMKVKDPSKIWSIQHQCRLELRPIYQETVLPVMRLLDMGYGRVNKQSAEIVGGNKMIGNWYAIAQICEFLIPINFYRDETLKQGEATILSSLEEAEGLKRAAVIVPVGEISSKVNIKPVKLDNDLLLSAANNHLVNRVKSNLKARNRLFKQVFKNLMSNMKSKLGSKMKNFFVSRKTKDNRYVKERSDKIIKESEAKVNEILDDDEALERTKRGLFRRRPKPEIYYKYKETKLIYVTLVIVLLLLLIAVIIFFAMG